MLKKMFKSCLAIAMICAMAAPVYAEVEKKVGVRGRAVAELVQTSIKDGASSLNMWSEGRMGLYMSAKEGDWSIGGVTEMRSNTNVFQDQLYNWVHVENDTMKIALGRQWWGMCYNSMYTGYSAKVDRYCYGIGGGGLDYAGSGYTQGSRDDRLILTLKGLGLQILAQMNAETAYNETVLGVLYPGKFGPVGVTVQFTSTAHAVDEKNAAHGAKGSAHDGSAAAELVAGVTFALNEAMMLEFNFESTAVQTGVTGADASSAVVMGLGANIGLGADMGFGAYMDTMTRADGSDNATTGTSLTVSFLTKLNGQQLFAAFNSSSAKDDDTGLDSGTTAISLGGRVNF